MDAKVTIDIRRPTAEATTLAIHGELTRLAEKPLDAAVAEAVAGGAQGIILDFSGLTYMNNKGAGLLVRLEARLRGQGRRLVVTGLNDHYRRVFRTTGLDEGIRVYTTEAQAVEAL
ncbi:MAG: STAS domain-containing protein [Anaerolineae bacterium]|jgi:anti-sigma B factor antagonist|nr:STAS domain-containing protein [Anaerolineae bacterium]